ncbi:MAG: lysylphosphatidylglycerol synthase domain-containing protein [candidate division WOR-3 bacterium]
MGNIINILSRIITIISIIFLFFKLSQYFHEIPIFSCNIRGILIIISSVLFCTSTIVVNAYIWKIILQGNKIYLSLKDAFKIVGRSQISKYLPGNVFQYLSRISLGRKAGISSEVLIQSIGVETLLLALAAASIGNIGLFFDKKAPVWLIEKIIMNRYELILLFVLMIIIIWFFSFSFYRPQLWIYSCIKCLKTGELVKSFSLCLWVFITYGFFISLLLNNLWGIETRLKWYQFSWGFSLAWFLGFITPGAPSGLGIRETVFYGLYHQEIHEGPLIGLVFILRVITGLGDLLGFAVAYFLESKKN